MKTKLQTWWNEPWTNGTYIKACGIGLAIGVLINSAWMAWYYSEEISNWFKKLTSRFKKKETTIEEEDP